MLFRDPRYLLVGFGAIAVLAIAVLLGITARHEYKQELAAFEERLQTEARLFAEHARLSIAAADLLIAGVEAGIQQDGLAAFTTDPAHGRMVRKLLEHTPQLMSLMVIDAEGYVRLTTTSAEPSAGMNVADRQYFQAHLNGEHSHIGAPVTGRGSGRRLIPVSVRLAGPDHEFQGVIVAALDIAYFEEFYTGEPQELDRRIGMYLRDGTILSLYPAPAKKVSTYVLDNSAPEFARHRTTSFIGPSPLDGSQKVIAFRQLDTYPVSVSVGADLDLFRARLYPAWTRGGFAFLAFTLGITVAVVLLYRSMQNAARSRETQLDLARRQREAERLSLAVIQHIPNGWVAIVDRDARYVFIDGKSFAGSDFPLVDEALGKTLYEMYPSAASRKIEQYIQRILAGSQALSEDEQELELPFQDSIYKVIIVPLTDENEQVEHVLLLTQDITELKHTQMQLETRNRQLQELSFKDSLLGIANRRAFDQALSQEWRRSLRQQRPLALLMIDVDHFKLFNDTYGHTAGDECLRRIADALSEAISRPGDMVARYGGEEFAVLLPDADLAGALHLAGHIHSQLAVAAIPFPGSPVGDVVTVCIGGAAMLPRQHMAPVALVEEADAGLYTAKRRGRNQTATAPDSG